MAMTVDDAITVLECSRPYTSSGCGASDEEIDEAMLMGAEALERTQWIPVCERLPEKDGRFLTYIVNPYNKFSYIMVCEYEFKQWWPDDDETSRYQSHIRRSKMK